MRKVGDVRQLEGKNIEIYGKVREYKGQAEIILNDLRQLRGQAAKIPAVPKDYDVANRGRYSAGKFKEARTKRDQKKKDRAGPITTEPPEEQDR